MIYFLTDWQLETEKLETNPLFNVIKTFNDNDEKNTIINMRLSAFLNYFVNQFDLSKTDNMIGLYDQIMKENSTSSAPLTMHDLRFPPQYEISYTRTNVLLTTNGELRGEVYFNAFGFVSQVHYLSSEGKEIQIYSEKGYILCKQFLDPQGQQIKVQFFDEVGHLILTEEKSGVKIGERYLTHFKYGAYASFKNVTVEIMNSIFGKFNPQKDRLLIDGQNHWLMTLVEDFSFPEAIVYLFSGQTQASIKQIDKHRELINKGKRIITDNPKLQKRLEENNSYRSLRNKLYYTPLYPTELALGQSSTYAEQYIYWKIERFGPEVKEVLLEFLQRKISVAEICLLIDSKVATDEREIQEFVAAFVSRTFEVDLEASEYQLVTQYYEALENEEMTPSLRELFITAKKTDPNFSRFIEAYRFISGFTFRHLPNLALLKNDLNRARIFVDQRENVEYFSHALAVSAGIPLIVKSSSPYVFENKNGLVLADHKHIVNKVESYLQDTDSWNQNLVDSVEIIQEYSAEYLMHKWKEELR